MSVHCGSPQWARGPRGAASAVSPSGVHGLQTLGSSLHPTPRFCLPLSGVPWACCLSERPKAVRATARWMLSGKACASYEGNRQRKACLMVEPRSGNASHPARTGRRAAQAEGVQRREEAGCRPRTTSRSLGPSSRPLCNPEFPTRAALPPAAEMATRLNQEREAGGGEDGRV